MTHLFISHSSRDGAAIAQPLAAALESAGHRCWIAPRGVKPGVLQEIQLASTARKTIAPVIVAGCALRHSESTPLLHRARRAAANGEPQRRCESVL